MKNSFHGFEDTLFNINFRSLNNDFFIYFTESREIILLRSGISWPYSADHILEDKRVIPVRVYSQPLLKRQPPCHMPFVSRHWFNVAVVIVFLSKITALFNNPN